MAELTIGAMIAGAVVLLVCVASSKFCLLYTSTVSKMAKGTDILTQNFARIADYLDCSVDYLLGRTDNPEVNK